jgi:SRSO17 transposase
MRVKRLLELHPVADGILVFDDTGLPKKGSASVGVAPQYSGTLGKISNCQVVVSAEYLADDPAICTPFHWPVSAHLFLPESWTKARRAVQTGADTRANQPANKARNCLGIARSGAAMGRPHPGGSLPDTF